MKKNFKEDKNTEDIMSQPQSRDSQKSRRRLRRGPKVHENNQGGGSNNVNNKCCNSNKQRE